MLYDLVISVVVYKPKIAQLQQTLRSLEKSNLKLKVAIFDNSQNPLDVKDLNINYAVDYFCNKKNLGFGHAHNQNIKKYVDQAPYFLILNPDVYFDTSLLDELLARMSADPAIGACIPRICHPQGHIQVVNRRLPRPIDFVISFVSHKFRTDLFKTKKYLHYQIADLDMSKPFVCPTISGCFMLFRGDVLKEVQGFDERFFLYVEDTDLSRRVSENYKIVVFSDLVAFHHWSRGAYRSPKLFLTFIRSITSYFLKWGWFWDSQREKLNAQVTYYKAPQKPKFLPTTQTPPMNPSSQILSQPPVENSVLNPAQV